MSLPLEVLLCINDHIDCPVCKDNFTRAIGIFYKYNDWVRMYSGTCSVCTQNFLKTTFGSLLAEETIERNRGLLKYN